TRPAAAAGPRCARPTAQRRSPAQIPARQAPRPRVPPARVAPDFAWRPRPSPAPHRRPARPWPDPPGPPAGRLRPRGYSRSLLITLVVRLVVHDLCIDHILVTGAGLRARTGRV